MSERKQKPNTENGGVNVDTGEARKKVKRKATL
jgi:hypothetical protein